MPRKTVQIIGRGPRVWFVRVYTRRDIETKKRKYLKPVRGRLLDAQAHLNKILGERDRGLNNECSWVCVQEPSPALREADPAKFARLKAAFESTGKHGPDPTPGFQKLPM